jgi:hypothetical protein
VISKKNKLIIIFAIIAVFLIIIILAFTPYVKYRESFIIGKTRNEIVDKYGDFDFNFTSFAVYKIPENFFDRIWRYFMGGRPINCYYIEFDDDGIAEKVYKSEYPGG